MLQVIQLAAKDSRVRTLLAAENAMVVLLECAIDRANSEDGPLAVAALGSMTDAEPSALISLATRAVERKGDLLRLVHEPSKAHSAAALIGVLSRALPTARPLFLDLLGSLPILGPRLEGAAAEDLAEATAVLAKDPALRELLSTPATTRWLAGLLMPPPEGQPLSRCLLSSLTALTRLASVPGGFAMPEVWPILPQLLGRLAAESDAEAQQAHLALLVSQIATSSLEGAAACAELGVVPLLAAIVGAASNRPPTTPGMEATVRATRLHCLRALHALALADERARLEVKDVLGGAIMDSTVRQDAALLVALERLKATLGTAA